MNACQTAFAYKMRQALNENLDHLPARTIDRLAAARVASIRNKKKNSPLRTWVSQSVLANRVGNFFGDTSWWTGSMALTASVLMAVIGLVAIYQSEQRQHVIEDVEIEAQIMTDDLPLTAYLDNGFNTYLNEQQN